MAGSGLSQECSPVPGFCRLFMPNLADIATPLVAFTGKDVPFVWEQVCSTAFYSLRDSRIHAPILAFPTETGQYILDTDASNFGLGGVLSQIQDYVECVVNEYKNQNLYIYQNIVMFSTGLSCLLFASLCNIYPKVVISTTN